MNRFARMILGGGAAFAACLLLVGPINWASGESSDGPRLSDPTMSETPSPSEPPSDDPSQPPPDRGDDVNCNSSEAVEAYLDEQGFRTTDYVIGSEQISWDAVPNQHADAAFSPTPSRTLEELDSFIEADGAASAAARGIIGDDAVVAGEWIAVQFLVPSQYSGNYHWDGSRAMKAGVLKAQSGDVWWINASRDCEADPEDSVRAICGNVGLDYLHRWVQRD